MEIVKDGLISAPQAMMWMIEQKIKYDDFDTNGTIYEFKFGFNYLIF